MVFIEGKTDITAREGGYNPQVLENLDRYFLELIKKERIQAAGYLMARHGKIFAHKTTGLLRYDQPDSRYRPDSLRKLASITKMYAAVAVMQLVEDGVLYLEQPAADFIPDFDTPFHKGITLLHLLTHSSGLRADGGYFLEPYPERRDLKNTNDLIRFALEGPLKSRPGTAWSYSTLGFAVIAEIVKRAGGMSFEEYVEKRILTPLGMHDTHFTIPAEKLDRVCITGEPEQRHLDLCQAEGNLFKGGTGLFSTLYDQFIFAQMFLNKGTIHGVRILGRKTVEAMTRNRLEESTTAFCWGLKAKSMEYGAGVSISINGIMSPHVINHEGYGRSALFADTAEDFVCMFSVPTALHWAPEIIENPRYIIWSGLE